MSDKKDPEQTKPENKTSAISSNTNQQTDISTSIDISSTLLEPSNEESAKNDHASGKSSDTSKNTSQTTSSIDKNQDKSTATVKNSASTTSTTANTKATKKSNSPKHKVSKLAILAIIIALLAIAASAGHYYWNELQKAQFSQQLSTELQKQLQLSQGQVTQQLAQKLTQQQQAHNAQLKDLKTSIERSTANSIIELQKQQQQQMASLRQKQPSDWLLEEAEYLIRVAARSLWLEKNTSTAISLLNDADLRIQELNDPQFLVLRQTIQQDIAKLQLLPALKTDEVILKLMALDQQIKQLPLAMVNVPDNSDTESSLELTENVSDWQANLTKTWRKFIADFITVNRRAGNVEPLMSPQFQQNLRENLSLKLQTATWAASQANSDIYRQSLDDIQSWLNDYFDMSHQTNQNFFKVLDGLKNETINVAYPNDLAALKALRQILSDKKAPVIEPTKIEQQEGV
ncbi:heme biosynthesis operon protein HemX [Colwellia sp. M166]|uniref:uroporphyrinogen-III C-methyltransferase n=1 Tax=Colwellia sp. M166 TaxID=2583805 RepID=UPI00211E4DE2|nr:uroporphyrinogen-III C-methyltransferase [Colwellia sp. M166]UUO23668.1 heme biosynthesis operon protein HemX [Colwellia sp. M166]|tara:strand:+ start:78993 stop:80369 length:1377 start_codon:yes stop_codon:yes gene_type:complete